MAAFTGTSVFATLTSHPHLYFKIFVGVISVLAAVLAAIQTFFRFSERAEKHRSVAVRYGAIRRDIEYLMSLNSDAVNQRETEKIKERFDNLSSDAPEITKRIWNKVEKSLANR